MPVPLPAALPYAEESEPAYVQHVAEHFELRPYGKGLLLACGPCPRCAAPLEIPVVLTTVRLMSWRAPARPGPIEVPMACNCDEDHDHRPDGVTEGCGAFWLLGVPAELA
ncbi:hypothetical protein QQY24_27140 [Streptomyces sp. TG1A-8]|uniref:hypothetical protein n=1 Tax=Streptomyces sp. TG1A-8 TaxID=3051385 RepID=UPI00265B8B10|nr:hypothetical protein [Streptomyces sp. TG1A-8]MDO0928908.1 hypothetical protein [Streptomyces sp. TG1A-8]